MNAQAETSHPPVTTSLMINACMTSGIVLSSSLVGSVRHHGLASFVCGKEQEVETPHGRMLESDTLLARSTCCIQAGHWISVSRSVVARVRMCRLTVCTHVEIAEHLTWSAASLLWLLEQFGENQFEHLNI